MNISAGALGGAIGGALGAAVWAACVYFLKTEIGWIAWGIGFVVGVGVRIGAGKAEGFGLGIVGSAIAVLAILAGKYIAVCLLVQQFQNQNPFAPDENHMIRTIADEVCGERLSRGEPVNFRPGMTLEEAEEPQDYPPAIWQEASDRWRALPHAEQLRLRNEQQEILRKFAEAMQGSIRWEAFKATFGLFDILWFILAVTTAYRVGAGGAEEGE